MAYIDGFVAAVPTNNKEAYIAHVNEAAVFLKKYGADRLVECWGDDIQEGSHLFSAGSALHRRGKRSPVLGDVAIEKSMG